MQTGRRSFIKHAVAGTVTLSGLGGILYSRQAPAVVASDSLRPMAPWGLQIGDVVDDRAIVWSRADKPRACSSSGRATRTSRKLPCCAVRTHSTSATDCTHRPHRPAGRKRRLRARGLRGSRFREGAQRAGSSVASARRRPNAAIVRFVWSGDTAGQGWGIDLGFGGMKIYEAMRRVQPDFFIHSGDTIYADGPLQERVTDATGKLIWTNAFLDVVPEKLKVAETLQEYRRNHLYNRYDANVQRFSAEVPQIWQWDDHEVTNNWSDGKVLDNRYTEQRIQTLTGRATRAFLEYSPMRWHNLAEAERVYRHIPYGRDLDVFVLDMRSYRGPNTYNRQEERSADTAFLGRAQLAWLKAKLEQSRATWKVIASDMPLGLQIGDGTDAQGRPRWEGPANGDGPVLGREFEIADLLRFIKREDIRNVVWLTADVHYCAAHYYDPNKAQFHDFDPFWEFVAGPLHAGSFGPNLLDNTFGPQVVFQKAPPTANTPPSGGFQFFGQIDIDQHSKDLTATLKDINGATVFTKRLDAKPSRDGRWD